MFTQIKQSNKLRNAETKDLISVIIYGGIMILFIQYVSNNVNGLTKVLVSAFSIVIYTMILFFSIIGTYERKVTL